MSRKPSPSTLAYRERRDEAQRAARELYGPRADPLVAEDLADDALCRGLAAYVDRYRRQHKRGPRWAELGEQARPDVVDDLGAAADELGHLAPRVYAELLCQALQRAGWITTGQAAGSMRPGPRYTPPARPQRPRKPPAR
ncbi:hypothetical protein JOL79_07035 [Microbispora sp. RL4-1S]|uniref:Uncharacterized protein n=1 Tax=Microbispora oryzae TaxID=2806554 RepID=A0A940WF70_9ACTN|nr:hypothetical protein [Microbispora oryzae]MBP2703553.1 hypothetical protein [Microbispora oryzae]